MAWWHRTHFKKKERVPKPPLKLVKIQRPIIGDDWLIRDEDEQIYQRVKPDPWMIEAVAGRGHAYFYARRHEDGKLEWGKRYKGRPLHW
jgi:hypothetical protein